MKKIAVLELLPLKSKKRNINKEIVLLPFSCRNEASAAQSVILFPDHEQTDS